MVYLLAEQGIDGRWRAWLILTATLGLSSWAAEEPGPVNPGQKWSAGLPGLLRGHTRDHAVEQRGSSRWLREAVGSASYQMQRGPPAPRFPHPQIMCGNSYPAHRSGIKLDYFPVKLLLAPWTRCAPECYCAIAGYNAGSNLHYAKPEAVWWKWFLLGAGGPRLHIAQ